MMSRMLTNLEDWSTSLVNKVTTMLPRQIESSDKLKNGIIISTIAFGGIVIGASIVANYIYHRNSYCISKAVRDKEASTKVFRLAHGGKIYYNEYGDVANGFPMLVFNGGLTCNLEGLLSDKMAKEHGLRLIVIDRVGCGQSTFPDYCKDVVQDIPSKYPLSEYMKDIKLLLTDELNLGDDEYGVSGVSHGGVFSVPSMYYLKPKFIVSIVGSPLFTKQVFLDKREMIGSYFYDWVVNSNSFWKFRIYHHIMRFCVLYLKSAVIKDLNKTIKDCGNKSLAMDNFNGLNISGAELMWYIAFSSYKYSIIGTAYANQIAFGQFGFDFDKDIDINTKKNLKIFFIYGKKDDINNYKLINQWINDYLIKKCKFENIEYDLYDNMAHIPTDHIFDKTYEKIAKYAKTLN